jgi:hypothetical protein
MADDERMDEDAMQQDEDDAAIESRIAVIKRGREEDSEEGSKRLRIETQAALGKKPRLLRFSQHDQTQGVDISCLLQTPAVIVQCIHR